MHGDLFSFKPNHAIYIVGYILRNLFSFDFPPVSLKLQSVFVFCHNTVTLLVVGGGFFTVSSIGICLIFGNCILELKA